MNSLQPCLFEEAANRIWPTALVKIGPKPASALQGIQAISFRNSNKIKAIAGSNKNFLTISSQEFGSDEGGDPNEWLH